jgi:hypothetical protein
MPSASPSVQATSARRSCAPSGRTPRVQDDRESACGIPRAPLLVAFLHEAADGVVDSSNIARKAWRCASSPASWLTIRSTTSHAIPAPCVRSTLGAGRRRAFCRIIVGANQAGARRPCGRRPYPISLGRCASCVLHATPGKGLHPAGRGHARIFRHMSRFRGDGCVEVSACTQRTAASSGGQPPLGIGYK